MRDHALDEEVLALERPALERRRSGAYYTPRALVACVLDAAAEACGESPARVVDPACGAGAFLKAAAERFPGSELIGVELSQEAAQACRARVPRAHVQVGDALRGAIDETMSRQAPGGCELWIGNPPYNGTSPLLRDARAYAAARALLPASAELPIGTSLRDDFAFFLLFARQRLARVRGVLAFVTPTSLLDAYLYAPLRRFLLDAMSLVEVLELGAGAFRGTRVRACVTVWKTRGEALAAPARYRARPPSTGAFQAEQLSAPQTFTPRAPDWLLRPIPEAAAALDQTWRDDGELLTQLVPVSLPGLKTRFDELLVDSDAQRLFARVEAFLKTREPGLGAFGAAHGIPPALLPKLAALHASLPRDFRARPECVRPFFRYAGARHRGRIPDSARAFCYLERAVIPRGDHRFRGSYDPHAEPVKLVFNARELPLAAALVTEPGCIHDHRHARFAPLRVPERVWNEGLAAATRPAPLGPPVFNLSLKGRAWAARLGGPEALFARLVEFINSPPVQEIWAPTFGAVRVLPVCERSLHEGQPTTDEAPAARKIARVSGSRYARELHPTPESEG